MRSDQNRVSEICRQIARTARRGARVNVQRFIALLLTFVMGCATRLPPNDPELLYGQPASAPVDSKVSSALRCLRDALSREHPRITLDVWVCPIPADGGLAENAPWHHVMEALLKASPGGGGPLTIRDGRLDYPVLLTEPLVCGPSGTSVTGRVTVENGLLARDFQATIGWGQEALKILGVGGNEEISRMELVIFVRDVERRVKALSPTVAAVYRSSGERNIDATIGIVNDVGFTASTGILRLTSREQILRYLAELAVFTLVTRVFELGTECLATTPKWEQAQREYSKFSSRQHTAVNDSVRRQLGGKVAVPGISPSADLELNRDEYGALRTGGTLARPPHSTVAEGAISTETASQIETAGFRLINNRLLSAVDGYVECFLTDGHTRAQALDVLGRSPHGRVFAGRAHPLLMPKSRGLHRVVCFRTAAPFYQFLPVAVRSGEVANVDFRKVRRIFEQRATQLAVAEDEVSEP